MQLTTHKSQPTFSLIHNFLENSVEAYPDKVALIHEDVRATYAEINSSANQLAQWIINQNIPKGERALFIFENCLEYVISYYGILKSGQVAVPINTDIKPDGLRPLIDELEPKVIIASSRFERLLKAIDLGNSIDTILIINNPKLKWEYKSGSVYSLENILQKQCILNPDLTMDESDPASIIYTSGSTGKPKGAMLSHRNITSNTHSICQYLHLTGNDIQVVVLPFFYVMGKSLLNTHFSVGGTVVINNKFAFPASVIKQMAEEKVTGFSGVPSTYAHLLHKSPLSEYRHKLHSLRYCSQAGGHMSKSVKEQLRQVLPSHTKIYIMYGATEASARLTHLEPDKYEAKMGSIGKPISGVTLQVLDKNGKKVPVGEKGELVASGPNIMLGYWKDKAGTEKVLDENGYHTGDQGYQDKEGYFYVTGRKDNLIKVGGHRINTQEVEDVIIETGCAIEVAVIGVPDRLQGNKLVALIVPKNKDYNEKYFLRKCGELLPTYKVPKETKLQREIPKKNNGKIDYFKCKRMCL